MSVRIGIDIGENVVIQDGWDLYRLPQQNNKWTEKTANSISSLPISILKVCSNFLAASLQLLYNMPKSCQGSFPSIGLGINSILGDFP